MDNIGEIIAIVLFGLIAYLNKQREKKKVETKNNNIHLEQNSFPASNEYKPNTKETKSDSKIFDFLDNLIFEESYNEPIDTNKKYLAESENVITTEVKKSANKNIKSRINNGMPTKTKNNTNINSELKKLLQNQNSLQTLFVAHEILGKPKSLQDVY